MLAHLALFGHGISAAAFTALAVWLIHLMRERGGEEQPAVQYALVAALFATAVWSISTLGAPTGSVLISSAETVRNAGWLMFMVLLLRANQRGLELSAAGYVYVVLFSLCAVQVMLLPAVAGSGASPLFAMSGDVRLLLVLRMLFAIGALMLVHDLYRSTASDARWGISLPMAALAAIWCYDLNYYAITYLTGELPVELTAARGYVVAATVPVIALGTRRNSDWKMRMSRSAAFQSASLAVIALYLLFMLGAAGAAEMLGGPYARLTEFGLLFLLSVAGLLTIPSDRFRKWLRVTLAKHFFHHRYDYRDEWMRFTDTIGRTDNEMGPIEHRVLKAVSDICASPGGLLLTPDNVGQFRVAGRWNWVESELPSQLLPPEAVRGFEERGFIVDLDNVRRGVGESAAFTGVPAWVVRDRQAWIMLPFVHFGRLVGVAVLQRPDRTRALDWEDLDMLRVASAQASSYLAEARSRQSLMEVQRFDEFNRRFAFIMHDIKNLVSQLSLLARNAERHADNPEFRADMVETLQGSVGKMNDLLARLSQHHQGHSDRPRPCDFAELAQAAIAQKSRLHSIALSAPRPITGMADPARVATILGHLLQNAIEASEAGSLIKVGVFERDGMAAISVSDRGKGISESFLREKLFKAFQSDKEGGFGIGAYEAQTLANAMGGRIDVESKPGLGSRFTLFLPRADGGERAIEEEAA